MRKKMIVAAICMAVGFVMLFATAFAGSTGTAGYDAYKSALKATAAAGSVTAAASINVKNNSDVLLEGTALVKAKHDSGKMMSAKVDLKAAGLEKTLEMYGQETQVVVKSSDSNVYSILDGKAAHGPADRSAKNPEALKAGEVLADALVGNMKDYFTVTGNPDGGSTVEFNLSGSQIPAAVNVFASLSAKKPAGHDQADMVLRSGMPDFMQGLTVDAPKLTDDVRVDSFSLKAVIDSSNLIKSQEIAVTLSGKDAEGKTHTRIFSFSANLSDIGNTTPDTIDLAGKQTRTIDVKSLNNHGFRS